MLAFFSVLPEVAREETRLLKFSGHDIIPDGEYDLVEYYCGDLNCDCRRVLISVTTNTSVPEVVAVFNYAWEPPEYYERKFADNVLVTDYSGVHLEPLQRQSEYAEFFRELFEEMIFVDPAYEARLRNHYVIFRAALGARAPRRSNNLVPMRRKSKKKRR